jgi:hypothetical protein
MFQTTNQYKYKYRTKAKTRGNIMNYIDMFLFWAFWIELTNDQEVHPGVKSG